jgi:hypothetical protein
MNLLLIWKSCGEIPVLERVDGCEPMSLFYHFCELVCGLLDLAKNLFGISQNFVYDDQNRVVPAERVMCIGKIANDLVTAGVPRVLRMWVGSRKQRHVITLTIGTIDERSQLGEPDKCLLTVTTLDGVPLQWRTPPVGVISGQTVAERCAERENPPGQKTSFETGFPPAGIDEISRAACTVAKAVVFATEASG